LTSFFIIALTGSLWADIVDLDKFTTKNINSLLSRKSLAQNPGDQIDIISQAFKGVKYTAHTLKGSYDEREEFTVNLKGVDCMTFIEYVEAMRRATDYDDFLQQLRKVRYYNSQVSYQSRKHFFTDWTDTKNLLYPVPDLNNISSSKTRYLNRKNISEKYLKGIPVKKRTVYYIENKNINSSTLKFLKNGDYIGVYINKNGLDVSHAGIYINKNGKHIFRHASSIYKKVVDTDFLDYFSGKPGLVIIRAIK